MTDRIMHIATVTAVSNDSVTVSVGDGSENCSGCAAKLLCKPVDENAPVLVIPSAAASTYTEGQRVRITLDNSKQWSATLVALVLPCVALGCGVAAASAAGLNQGLSALAGLATTGLYFGILYMIRSKVQQHYTWKIEKL